MSAPSLRTTVAVACRRFPKHQRPRRIAAGRFSKRKIIYDEVEGGVGPRGVPPISISVQDVDDRTLISLGLLSTSRHSQPAREEILKRHIMDVDNVSYEDATATFIRIEERNRHGLFLVALPYQIGVFTASVAALAALPLVFHLPTVEMFNELAVTTEVPPQTDLEYPLEVAIWSWNWMEPPLGSASFILLCMQYIRGQMVNLGMRPYTSWIKSYRGKRLADEFPQYDRKILRSYSETATFVNKKDWRSSGFRRSHGR